MRKTTAVTTTVSALCLTVLCGRPKRPICRSRWAKAKAGWISSLARLHRTWSVRQNYDWVTQFEKQTGCAVNVKTAATSDEMVSLMAKGGYDLVTASGDASLRLIFGKRVQPINTALIPNWKNIDPRLLNGARYTVDGKTYGTPYQWGPNLLMYNTKTFPTPPDSWAVIFQQQNLPDGKSNRGRVQAYDGPIYIADAALFLKATQPQLGISDPYQLNEEQYQAALKLLRQHALIHRYWHDTSVQMSDFKTKAWWPPAHAVSGQRPEGRRAADRHRVPERGRDRLGGHHHAAYRRQAPELRLPVDELVAGAEGAGRRGGFGSGRCRRHRRAARPARCWVRRAAKPTASTSSTKSPSGKRRRRRGGKFVPYSRWTRLHRHHGRPLISPSYFKPPLCWLPALTPVTYDLYAPGDAFGCRLDAARIILRIGLVRLRVVAQSAEVI